MAWLDFFVCLLFGILGVHIFREGRTGMGIVITVLVLMGAASCNFLPTKYRQDTTMRRDEILDAGYIPCKVCNP